MCRRFNSVPVHKRCRYFAVTPSLFSTFCLFPLETVLLEPTESHGSPPKCQAEHSSTG